MQKEVLRGWLWEPEETVCGCVARSRLEHRSVSQPKLPFTVTELVGQLEDACPQGKVVQTVHCEGASLLASGVVGERVRWQAGAG